MAKLHILFGASCQITKIQYNFRHPFKEHLIKIMLCFEKYFHQSKLESTDLSAKENILSLIFSLVKFHFLQKVFKKITYPGTYCFWQLSNFFHSETSVETVICLFIYWLLFMCLKCREWRAVAPWNPIKRAKVAKKHELVISLTYGWNFISCVKTNMDILI